MLALRTPIITAAIITATGCVTSPPITSPAWPAAAHQAIAVSPPQFAVRTGDKIEHILTRIGEMDGHVYIYDSKAKPVFTTASAPIRQWADLAAYIEASGYDLTISGEGTYRKVGIKKSTPKAANPACETSLYGTMPLGVVISDICSEANLECQYPDPAAAAKTAALYTLAYKGSCFGAIEHLAKKADLYINSEGSTIELRMVDTVTMDIGIPHMDRKVANEIIGSQASSGSAGGSGGSASATTTTSQSGQNARGKTASSEFKTNYLVSIKSLLKQTISPYGTYSYLPETGQLIVRDKQENLSVIQDAVSRLSAAYQDRYSLTLSFYRLTVNKDLQIGGNITTILNSAVAGKVSIGSLGGLASATAPLSLALTKGASSLAIKAMSEIGAVEMLDTYSLTAQGNVPITQKIARNIDYVRNISQTQTAQTTGTTTSSIEQASVTDGAFLSVMAYRSDADQIAVEVNAYINRLDGFDTTETPTVKVLSPRSSERSFDSMAILQPGIPYVVAAVSQKSRDDRSESIPGTENSFLSLFTGSRNEASTETHIIFMIEARKQ